VAKRDRKKKARGRRSGGGRSGRLSGMRSGMKSLVGTGGKNKKKESLVSKIITYLLLAAAIAFLAYRIYTR
jgi:hypothetical protein